MSRSIVSVYLEWGAIGSHHPAQHSPSYAAHVTLDLRAFRFLRLSGLTVLGVLAAIALEASAIGGTFPFWGMLVFSLGCTVLLAAYHARRGCLLEGEA